MNSDYGWFPTANPISDTPARELPHDIASVARLWVSTVYDDLRCAGPDRATRSLKTAAADSSGARFVTRTSETPSAR
ncbi:hypothetical protein M6B22_16975 [Jatrophihabitans cynanchi]|jgi:hypothetical protein|uniref:Uncharacterized protein n=1 Tax=Jatrophihabitans cynanchi TaxID=2944128 RepID=A0ABY7JUK1_9ACTN|nr:hypothetical protein [Jatrophihabitans sp. SB3-54]WAX56214.1 hypothetical protein M6B22_16975 [Jatrophihabitans sp. SB3-54]